MTVPKSDDGACDGDLSCGWLGELGRVAAVEV